MRDNAVIGRGAILRVFDPIGRPLPRTAGGFDASGPDRKRSRGCVPLNPASGRGFVISGSAELLSSPFNIMILMRGRFLLMSSSEGSSIGFRDKRRRYSLVCSAYIERIFIAGELEHPPH